MNSSAFMLIAAILILVASGLLLRRTKKLSALARSYLAEADQRHADALKQQEKALATHLDTKALLEEHMPHAT